MASSSSPTSPQPPQALTPERLEIVARVVHEATRAFQAGLGQAAAPPWEEADDWMRVSSREGVVFRVENPGAAHSAQHDQWMVEKRAAGWRYGAVKDAQAKTHPLMIPYDELPEDERRKDALFGAIVDALVTAAV